MSFLRLALDLCRDDRWQAFESESPFSWSRQFYQTQNETEPTTKESKKPDEDTAAQRSSRITDGSLKMHHAKQYPSACDPASFHSAGKVVPNHNILGYDIRQDFHHNTEYVRAILLSQVILKKNTSPARHELQQPARVCCMNARHCNEIRVNPPEEEELAPSTLDCFFVFLRWAVANGMPLMSPEFMNRKENRFLSCMWMDFGWRNASKDANLMAKAHEYLGEIGDLSIGRFKGIEAGKIIRNVLLPNLSPSVLVQRIKSDGDAKHEILVTLPTELLAREVPITSMAIYAKGEQVNSIASCITMGGEDYVRTTTIASRFDYYEECPVAQVKSYDHSGVTLRECYSTNWPDDENSDEGDDKTSNLEMFAVYTLIRSTLAFAQDKNEDSQAIPPHWSHNMKSCIEDFDSPLSSLPSDFEDSSTVDDSLTGVQDDPPKTSSSSGPHASEADPSDYEFDHSSSTSYSNENEWDSDGFLGDVEDNDDFWTDSEVFQRHESTNDDSSADSDIEAPNSTSSFVESSESEDFSEQEGNTSGYTDDLG